ncbi:spore coat protein [Cohnella sp. CFH 77786]|uniref:spore coat protein n=1 Tax=Cohnella sp. CFH 77786 TaxID=2662265 RepID=UPI001C609FC3|nr:spore coat protein [Cohnella sp. CFH 77786]MBW5446311.1 spore coat protein [Cohnella sp. CFH 77786]
MAAHETMEVHEMLNFKTLCLAQSKLMQGLVFDRDLKRLMQKDVEMTMKHIGQLQGLYAKIRLQ